MSVVDHQIKTGAPPQMKVRLFWTMLIAFMLVIVLGVAGMLGFFALAMSGIWLPSTTRANVQGDFRAELETAQRTWSQYFATQYTANGNSWANIDQRLGGSVANADALPSYLLVDSDRMVIASNGLDWPSERQVDPMILTRGMAVDVQGKRVGTLVVLALPSSASPFFMSPSSSMPPRAFNLFWPVLRGFVMAGAGLATVLLGLAVVFARQLTRPLRNITAAAQALEAGQLDVQVQSAPVRELDDLAHAFNAMARSLADADHQRRQMTADIAHELRTPLTIIKGRLEGLQDGVYSATPDQIERILNETALLERLIDDLRLLALADAGQLPLYPECIEPGELLEGMAASFSDQLAAQGVTLRIEASPSLPIIHGDPLRLAQVLSNLLTNALRHTPAGGTITLQAEARVVAQERDGPTGTRWLVLGGWNPISRRMMEQRGSVGGAMIGASAPTMVILRVCDTGIGIDPQDLPHIFKRFWRADRSRARGSGGTGLGLAITRQIVVAHGGAIWAESTPHQGTIISIALPAMPAEM